MGVLSKSKTLAVARAFFVATALALFASGAAQAQAQEISLTSPDGAIDLSGRFLGFDGRYFRLDTIYGELSIDGTDLVCDGAGCPDLDNFVAEFAISGAPAIGSILLPALVEGFARRNGLTLSREELSPERFALLLHDPRQDRLVGRFTLRLAGTEAGFADLLANRTDMVMALREIREKEREHARAAGLGDMSARNSTRVLALDALVPIVAPGNPLQTISPEDLARAIAGEVENWAQLGGQSAPLTVHLPDLESGLFQAIQDRLLRPAGKGLSDAVQLHKDVPALTRYVTQDPQALGVTSFSKSSPSQIVALSGSCGFVQMADRRAIKSEDYALSAPLFLYLPARRLPALARDFLAFTRSLPAQAIIRRSGFINLTPEEIPINGQGARLANAIKRANSPQDWEKLQQLVSALGPLRRLTTSFRFDAQSVRLDAQSRSNVEQLARALERGLYDARRLVFVGFSDGRGSRTTNQSISERRARAVRDAVISATRADIRRLDIDVSGFGEALPMACDDTPWGRQVNRRVEVWVR